MNAAAWLGRFQPSQSADQCCPGVAAEIKFLVCGRLVRFNPFGRNPSTRRGDRMRRREFFAGRVGAKKDPEAQASVAAFAQIDIRSAKA
jgi:hypothetical protein